MVLHPISKPCLHGIECASSNYDFYIVVDSSETDRYDQTLRAYKAIRPVRTRPVDILVGTSSTFERRRQFPGIEREVCQKGVLLYG